MFWSFYDLIEEKINFNLVFNLIELLKLLVIWLLQIGNGQLLLQ